jgi:hypothetical protein
MDGSNDWNLYDTRGGCSRWSERNIWQRKRYNCEYNINKRRGYSNISRTAGKKSSFLANGTEWRWWWNICSKRYPDTNYCRWWRRG